MRQRLRSPVPPREVRRGGAENCTKFFGARMRGESIQRRDAENAEISAEKTKRKPNSNQPQGHHFLRLSSVFSAIPLRSLRLCVEKTPPLSNTLGERPSPC